MHMRHTLQIIINPVHVYTCFCAIVPLLLPRGHFKKKLRVWQPLANFAAPHKLVPALPAFASSSERCRLDSLLLNKQGFMPKYCSPLLRRTVGTQKYRGINTCMPLVHSGSKHWAFFYANHIQTVYKFVLVTIFDQQTESKSPSLPEMRWELHFLNPFVLPRRELNKPVPSKAFYSQLQKPLLVTPTTFLCPNLFTHTEPFFLHPAQYKAQQKLTLGIIAGLHLVNGRGGAKNTYM